MDRPNECPQCFTQLPPEALAALQEDDVPQLGDYSLCGTCGTFLIFTSVRPIVFRAATKTESEAHAMTEDGRAALELLASYRAFTKQIYNA